LNEIWAGEVVDEPHGVPAKAADHHRWGGQPYKALARKDMHTIDLFQCQNPINIRKFNLNRFASRLILSGAYCIILHIMPKLVDYKEMLSLYYFGLNKIYE
jgi:hypothetical protein